MFITLVASLTVLGLVIGSFAGAQVWRLRARQLREDKDGGEDYDKAEYARLKSLIGQKTADDRSRCLHCAHTLAWYDLVPLLSWVSTKGKCRYCQRSIGSFEPLIELGTAVTFGIFSAYWAASFGLSPIGIVLLLLWLIALTMLIILFAYDVKWFLLPDRIVFPLIVVAVVIQFLLFVSHSYTNGLMVLASIAGSIAILSGLYFLLWLISRGQWVGFGDVKLGIALGLLVADWKLALLTLFLANLIGTLIVLPGLILKKLSRKSQVPFGPFLILGCFIALLWGSQLIAGYESFTIWLTSILLML